MKKISYTTKKNLESTFRRCNLQPCCAKNNSIKMSSTAFKNKTMKMRIRRSTGWLEFCKNEPNVLYLNFELFGTRSGRTQPQNST